MTPDVRTLLPIAEQAVTIAADILTTRLPGVVTAKGDRDMATEVDYAVEHAVRDFLTRETPEIAFLGEEEGGPARGAGPVWALDPVDGTANFLHGIPLCGVSLGLIDGDTSVLGVIDLPFLSSRYSAAHGHGAHLDGRPIHCGQATDLAEAIVGIGDYAVGQAADTRNRLRLAVTGELAARVQRVRMFGSAAVDLAWVAQGRIDAAIMLSNKPWDTAAGVLIAREAGAVVVDLDGTPHTVNAQATIATTPAILTDLLNLIAEADKNLSRETRSRPALTNPPQEPT
ncbi:inositol monophosphatase family protein [Streptosporangium saharense]|uniref:Inositol-1-monophosphatase n=1 Tax=Streptosporangium saharense TaxID=1706840 RepID=A0A7W7VSV3_9ACTN|nr:inositol monophosphatase family protein [Streptosporangium saharense]MBB4920790.1 myo-inositol-1(or 4)-monophosphatase [Streptosporangium saharense]